MNRTLARRAFLAATVAALVPASASAATAFNVGAGGSPDVAVAADGTAHVVWHNSDTKRVDYCRIPPGASGCAASPVEFDNGDPTTVGHPLVLIAPDGKIVVATGDSSGAGGNNRMQVRISADGGATFGSAIQAGTSLADNAILSADGTRILSSTEEVSGGFLVQYQSAPLTGTLDNAKAGLLTGSGSYLDADLAQGPASQGSPLIVVYSGSGTSAGGASQSGVLFNRYLGGDDNATASWSSASVLADGSDGRVAGGAGGVLAMYKNTVDGGLHYVLSAYDPATSGWTTPANISAADTSIGDNDVTEAPNGTFHAVYKRQEGNGTSVLRYNRPGFVNPGSVAVDTVIFRTRVAANDAGKGLAVWAGSLNDNTIVRAARIEDLIPGSGGPASNQPASSTPTTPGPVEKIPAKTGATDKVGPGGAYQSALLVPKTCVHLPNQFRASVTFKQIKTVRDTRLPSRGQFRAVKVRFRFDNKFARFDLKAAFTTVYGTLGLKTGTTHVVSANVYLRQRRFKTVNGKRKLVTAKKLNVRTLRAKVKVC